MFHQRCGGRAVIRLMLQLVPSGAHRHYCSRCQREAKCAAMCGELMLTVGAGYFGHTWVACSECMPDDAARLLYGGSERGPVEVSWPADATLDGTGEP